MMPPNCCLCDKGLETGDACELVCFLRTAEDEAWHREMSDQPQFTGHPPDCDWFCSDHLPTAYNLKHSSLSLLQTLNRIRQQEAWVLLQIDLFDRDTPATEQSVGLGFESGFTAFWKHLLSTVNAAGARCPLDYRLRIHNQDTDYRVQRYESGLVQLRQFVDTRRNPVEFLKSFVAAQAGIIRRQGIPAADDFLSETYRCLPDTQAVSRFLRQSV
jgi:hypothetical protein